jgi:CheY-like chemotaxis protein
VQLARDGVAAFRLACEFQPRFVVLDIGMPQMNGYEVAEKIRMQRWGRDTVLIALTGWGQVADKRTAIASGFDIHLTKPVDPAVLQSQLEAAIGRRKSG